MSADIKYDIIQNIHLKIKFRSFLKIVFKFLSKNNELGNVIVVL